VSETCDVALKVKDTAALLVLNRVIVEGGELEKEGIGEPLFEGEGESEGDFEVEELVSPDEETLGEIAVDGVERTEGVSMRLGEVDPEIPALKETTAVSVASTALPLGAGDAEETKDGDDTKDIDGITVAERSKDADALIVSPKEGDTRILIVDGAEPEGEGEWLTVLDREY
jgi:hypothetical protein